MFSVSATLMYMSTKSILTGTVFISLLGCALLASALTMTPKSVGGQGSVRPTCTALQSDLLRYRASDSSTRGDVTRLQNFLVAKGLLNTQPTGYFGLGTFAAVRAYQAQKGLSQSGYVGVLTKAKIQEESCNLPTTQPVKNPTSGTDIPGTSTGSILCSLEIRMCPDGSKMPRDSNCTWLPEKCSPQAIKKVIGDIPTCLTMEYKACPDGKPMPRQGCAWLPERCGVATTTVSSVKVSLPVQTITKPVVEETSPKAVACTMMMRLCPDGSSMPRDASCNWHPEQCPADGGGMQCTKDTFTGQVTCGAPGTSLPTY